MYLLLKMWIFQYHISFQGCIFSSWLVFGCFVFVIFFCWCRELPNLHSSKVSSAVGIFRNIASAVSVFTIACHENTPANKMMEILQDLPQTTTSASVFSCFGRFQKLHSLKLTYIAPENRQTPKRKRSYSKASIFRGELLMLVSGIQSPNMRMGMEPKYLAFRRWLETTINSWEYDDWCLGLVSGRVPLGHVGPLDSNRPIVTALEVGSFSMPMSFVHQSIGSSSVQFLGVSIYGQPLNRQPKNGGKVNVGMGFSYSSCLVEGFLLFFSMIFFARSIWWYCNDMWLGFRKG